MTTEITTAPAIKIGRRDAADITIDQHGNVALVVVARNRNGDRDLARCLHVFIDAAGDVSVDALASDRFGEAFHAECERAEQAVRARIADLRAAATFEAASF